MPSVVVRAIALVRSIEPKRRASAAGTGSLKKNHTCAPSPERERSIAGASWSSSHTSRIALTSDCQERPSRSIASSQHVSSASSG